MTGILQDQVAVVTGAARGIGEAIAHRLAGMGALSSSLRATGQSVEKVEQAD